MKKKRNIGVLLMGIMVLVSLVWYGCTKENDSEAENLGTIYGTVTDYATGEPVRNASIKLKPSGETTQTGSDGSYEFRDLKAGKYTLFLSKAEYADLDDDYVLDLEAGKKIRRDVQMRKNIASLKVTDMSLNDLATLDFGLEESVTSKSFNIFNNGTVGISVQLSYNCAWLDTVIALSTEVLPGQTLTVTVIIDRAKLSAGENATYLHIISANGSNEVKITATGYGAPTVATGSVTNITATSATCSGNVTDDGGTRVSARGLCWGTSDSPRIESDEHQSFGDGTGNFSITMSHLSANTHYFVRAFATNARGTSYGEQRDFTTAAGLPTVVTTAVRDVTSNSAVCEGNVTAAGDAAVTERGICWGTSNPPTIDNGNKIPKGSGTGTFSASITGLNGGTTYYASAYATNSFGTSYGDAKQFTTLEGKSVVAIGDVSDISATSAVCSGSISSDGGFAITAKGFVWSTSQYPTLENCGNNKTDLGSGNAQFTGSLSSLVRNTTYYVRAYATNSQGTSYSTEQRSFTTKDGLPVVTTTAMTLSNNAISTGGHVVSDGGFPVTERGICYGIYPNPDLSDTYTHTADIRGGTGYYTTVISTEGIDGMLYIRAYATNANGTVYGDEIVYNQDYYNLPTFNHDGHTYRVAPDPFPEVEHGIDTTTAKSYCNNTLYGYNDWRLPTEAEMNTMFANKDNIGGFLNRSGHYIAGYYYRKYYIYAMYNIGQSVTINNIYCYYNTSTTVSGHVRPIRQEN